MGGLEEQGRTLSSLTDEELKVACRAAGGDLHAGALAGRSP
jgi:hypothetical protein